MFRGDVSGICGKNALGFQLLSLQVVIRSKLVQIDVRKDIGTIHLLVRFEPGENV